MGNRQTYVGSINYDIAGLGGVKFEPNHNDYNMTIDLLDKANNIIISLWVIDDKKEVKLRTKDGDYLLDLSNVELFERRDEDTNHWLSFNSVESVLHYGKGEYCEGCSLYKMMYISTEIAKITKANIYGNGIKFTEMQSPVESHPMLVVSKITRLEEVGKFKIAAALHKECLILYDTAKSLDMNDKDFPEFIDTIEWSTRNPKGWCYKKLREKANYDKLVE